MAKKETTAIVTASRTNHRGDLVLTLSPESKKPKVQYLRLHNGEVITKKDWLENKGEKPFREIVLDIFVKANLITELNSKCDPINIEKEHNGKEEKSKEEKSKEEKTD